MIVYCRCCLSGCFTAVRPEPGTAAAAGQWQRQVSSLILTVSCSLIHSAAFRTLDYIYRQLTLQVRPHPPLIPSFSEDGGAERPRLKTGNHIILLLIGCFLSVWLMVLLMFVFFTYCEDFIYPYIKLVSLTVQWGV